jgi:tRNA nucleotidyltransferase (CCA-adding enzyme)
MFNIPQEVQYVMQQLNINGYQSYLVGGCVRDMLLSKEPKDFDICTSALPDDVVRIFNHVIPTGLQHGTVTVIVNKMPIEVTTMRKDGIYKDFRRPDAVIFTDKLEEDVMRRDFTINALALDSEYNLYDYVGGMKDLHHQTIRAVGNPDHRFREDPLRMMRCKRLGCQLGFTADESTSGSIVYNSHLIQKVSVERINDELCKILVSDKPVNGILYLHLWGLLKYIMPELCDCYNFDQHNPNHDKDVFQHTLEVLRNTPNKLPLRLGALLHDIGKPKCFSIDDNGIGHFYKHHLIGADMSEEILKRMKFDNKTIETVTILVRYHMDRYDSLKTSNIKKFINRVGKENLDNLFELQIADVKGSKPPHDFTGIEKLRNQVQEILNKKEPLTVKDLDINGHDLMQLGIKQGKEIGNILNVLLESVLENPNWNNKETLLILVRKLIK